MSVRVPNNPLSTAICWENNSDFLSIFHRICKRKWLNIVKGSEEYSNALGLIGESLQIEDPLLDMIESMGCQTYGFLNKSNVNEVQYEKCCGRNFLNLLNFSNKRRVTSTR